MKRVDSNFLVDVYNRLYVVRNSLVPLLINYFKDKQMIVKWHGLESTVRALIGGGPQGTLGGLHLSILPYTHKNINPNTMVHFMVPLYF